MGFMAMDFGCCQKAGCRHSEKCRVYLDPLEGDLNMRRRCRTNQNYGEAATAAFHLPREAKFRVALKNINTGVIVFRSTSGRAAAGSGDIPVAVRRCAGGAHTLGNAAAHRSAAEGTPSLSTAHRLAKACAPPAQGDDGDRNVAAPCAPPLHACTPPFPALSASPVGLAFNRTRLELPLSFEL